MSGTVTNNALGVAPVYGVNADYGPTVSDVADTENPIAKAVRSYIAPQPGYTYGDVLPLKMGPTGGVSLAIPNALRSIAGGAVDLMEGPDTGIVTPQATNALLASAAPELAKSQSEGQMNVFAGLGSKTANLAKVQTAQGMTDASRNAVFGKTGFYQDPSDGQWRYEIPDGPASLTGIFNKAQTAINTAHQAQLAGGPIAQASRAPGIQTTLDQILNHPQLFKAYPDIAKMKVSVAPSGTLYDKGVMGGYTPAGRFGGQNYPEHLYVASDLNPVEAKETVLHEVQHAIQSREGFAPGGDDTIGLEAHNRLQTMAQGLPPGSELPDWALTTPWNAYRGLAGEVEARNVEQRSGMSPQQVSTLPPWYTEPKIVGDKINADAVAKAWSKYVDDYHAGLSEEYSDMAVPPWLAGKGTK